MVEGPGFYAPVEHYRARGGSAVLVVLRPGDSLEVIDREGGQAGEIAVLSPRGGEDPGALGIGSTVPARGLAALRPETDEEAAQALRALQLAAVDAGAARGATLFGSDSPPGARVAFVASRDALCIVAAPGGAMSVDRQDPPTALTLRVRRVGSAPPLDRPVPPPLAEPRLDIRIDRASARAFEVREGEYLQIIDVAGRQCSDFLAFNLRDLEHGRLRELDATTTRTLNGTAYPAPGLFAKFFDTEMRPMVELVRDTVGRHDAFLLACYAKYYEDLGYPGHLNCSDNFNAALAPFGIEPRKGWPAINYFNNSAITPTNVVAIDECWSRPGDYVLMRAATDLLCASSACPDDIAPANGWNPTDIHLRVYAANKFFSKGVAFRMSPEAAPQLTQQTAFHERTSALTSRFGEYRGYWLPVAFDGLGPQAEYLACRERVAVMDLSALRKFEVLGPDAEQLLQRTLTRDVSRLATGQVVYSALCNETGGMLDDGTLLRLGDNNFRWICSDDHCGAWLRQKAADWGLHARVKTSTDQIQNLAVQGPRSRALLERIVWTPPAQPSLVALQPFRFLVGRLGNYDGEPVMVSRTGYTGELGYELWCHPNHALALWDAIWEVGKSEGLAPCGSAAMDILRIEAGLVFSGLEFDDQVDPFEAGIGFAVALRAKADVEFAGKAALTRRQQAPGRRLVGLVLEGNEIAGHGDGLFQGRSRVGVVTSGTRSPLLRRNIALARVAIEFAEPGTSLEVGKLDGHQKRLPARVVPIPFYDPTRSRVRS